MPTRDRAPIGAPCWTDLWTSDVEASRRFCPAGAEFKLHTPNQ